MSPCFFHYFSINYMAFNVEDKDIKKNRIPCWFQGNTVLIRQYDYVDFRLSLIA